MTPTYEPIWIAETAADDTDRKMLSPRSCEICGRVMDNGMDDICPDCVERMDVSDDD